MREIVGLQMAEVQQRLQEHGLKIELTENAREYFAQTGFDPTFGARPLRRVLQKQVESPLSIRLLSGEFIQGDVVLVDIDDDEKVVFRKDGDHSEPPPKHTNKKTKTE